jgi:hypothetical protein
VCSAEALGHVLSECAGKRLKSTELFITQRLFDHIEVAQRSEQLAFGV